MKIRLNKNILSFVGAFFMRLIGITWRVEYRGLDNLRKARDASGNVILAFWHGRLLALSYTHRGKNIQVLASEHYDGDLMGRIIARLGFGHLKGSTSRGGHRAMRDLKSVLEEGLDAGLAADGPRGPRGRLQQGAVELARLTGRAVLPLTSSASRRKLFRSWDCFQVPLPFSRVVVEYGEPLIMKGDENKDEREQAKDVLQRRLNELTAALDRSIGYRDKEVWPHEDI
ncbi:MAG: lysophospholipid acyltransferase family protein [Candidatus Krumholzibacteriales bacterium]